MNGELALQLCVIRAAEAIFTKNDDRHLALAMQCYAETLENGMRREAAKAGDGAAPVATVPLVDLVEINRGLLQKLYDLVIQRDMNGEIGDCHDNADGELCTVCTILTQVQLVLWEAENTQIDPAMTALAKAERERRGGGG